VAKPGMTTCPATFWRSAQALLFDFTNMFTRAISNIRRTELAAALLGQVMHRFEKEPLTILI
jgi:hypothetical protein